MPDQQAHLSQARHNHDLIAALDPATTPFLDWVVTGAFYAALHLVEAWFASRGFHFMSHAERDDWVSKVRELRRIVWPRYKELEFQSQRARYQCVTFDRNDVQKRLLVYLADIEQEIRKLIQGLEVGEWVDRWRAEISLGETLLDPRYGRRGSYHARWNLRLNVDEEHLLEWQRH